MSEKTDLQIDVSSDRCDDKVTDNVPALEKFKIGDIVICNVNGQGVVTEIESGSSYPILVEFGFYYETYTENGRMYLGSDDEGEHIRHLTKLDKALK